MKYNAIVIASFFAIFSLLPASSAEAAIQNPNNLHWYEVVTADDSASNYWDSARQAAIALGGDLVTINDSAEQQWIYQNIISGTYRNYWIGLNDALTEGTLEWSSGDSSTYTNWNPLYKNTDGKDYAFIRQSDGLWDIGYKNDYKLAIAELPASTAPEPVSSLLFLAGGITLIFRSLLPRSKYVNNPFCNY